MNKVSFQGLLKSLSGARDFLNYCADCELHDDWPTFVFWSKELDLAIRYLESGGAELATIRNVKGIVEGTASVMRERGLSMLAKDTLDGLDCIAKAGMACDA